MRYIIAAGIVLALVLALGFSLAKSLEAPVSAAPPAEGHLITVVEGLAIEPPATSVTTAFIDTSDCRLFVVFTDASASMTVYLHPSPDGVFSPDKVRGITSGEIVGETISLFPDILAAPQMAIEFERSDPTVFDTIDKAWLYCAH